MDVGASSLTLAQVQQAAADAARAALPPFASVPPKPEMTGGAAGSQDAIPRADHAHPRLTATATGTLKADGTQVVVFTRTFSALPAVTILEIGSPGSSSPTAFKVQSWAQDAQGNYTGCTIYGSRARALPLLTALGVTSLLAGVITGTNALITALTGYVPTEAAAGAQFTLIALQPTTAS